jgi:hypothetical protein
VAAQVLAALGADLSRVRQQVIQLLSGYAGRQAAAEPAGARTRLVRMTVPEELREAEERLAPVRREKEAAIDAEDFESGRRTWPTQTAAGCRSRRRSSLDRAGQLGDRPVAAALEPLTGRLGRPPPRTRGQLVDLGVSR